MIIRNIVLCDQIIIFGVLTAIDAGRCNLKLWIGLCDKLFFYETEEKYESIELDQQVSAIQYKVKTFYSLQTNFKFTPQTKKNIFDLFVTQ